MPFRSDDPAADFDRWDREQERHRARLPRCTRCREHIQDDDLWNIDGDLYCQRCAEFLFMEPTDNYVEEN